MRVRTQPEFCSFWQALSVTVINMATYGPWPLCGWPRDGVLSSDVAVSLTLRQDDSDWAEHPAPAVLGPGALGLGRGQDKEGALSGPQQPQLLAQTPVCLGLVQGGLGTLARRWGDETGRRGLGSGSWA